MTPGSFLRYHCTALWLSLLLITGNCAAQNFDINLLKSINPQHPSSDVWRISSDSYTWVSGAATLGTLGYALATKDKKLRYKSYEMIAAVGINVVTTGLLKQVIDRRRPEQVYPNDIFVVKESSGRSFPSGHASLAFATATTLTLNFRKWYVIAPAYLWAGCVGYSRMYYGRHFPTDVLAGAAVGAGSAFVSHWLQKKLLSPKTNSK